MATALESLSLSSVARPWVSIPAALNEVLPHQGRNRYVSYCATTARIAWRLRITIERQRHRDRIHNNPKVSICPQCIIHEPKESSAITGFQARLTTYTNFCILPSCLKKPSSGSDRLSTMSGRFRRMLDALQDTFYTSSSRGWNPRTGSQWQALAREFMKFVFIRVLNIVSFTSRSSAREFTCFTPFRRKHDRRRRVISIWQGDD